VKRGGLIAAPEASDSGIFQDLGPHVFGFPHHHGIGMFQRLFGMEAYVEPPHNYRDPPAPELSGDFVGPLRGGAGGRDSYQVVGPMIWDGLQTVINDLHPVSFGGKTGQIREGDAQKPAGSAAQRSPVRILGSGLYQ